MLNADCSVYMPTENNQFYDYNVCSLRTLPAPLQWDCVHIIHVQILPSLCVGKYATDISIIKSYAWCLYADVKK